MRGKLWLISLTAVLGMGVGFAMTSLLSPQAVPAASSSPQPYKSDLASSARAAGNAGAYAAALIAADAIGRSDFAALSDLTHPELGCLFAPFSTVDRSKNPVFLPADILIMGTDKTEYVWGDDSQSDQPLLMTPALFFQEILQIRDFAAAPAVGFDTVLRVGNAVENVLSEYPGCRIVDLYFPGEGKDLAGADWASLKLVFSDYRDTLMLVAVVRSVYTEQ